MRRERSALVTGASRGIGAAIAAGLASEGWDVLAPGRRELDLSSAESIAAYLASIDSRQVDVLVNNAAENCVRPIADLTGEQWARALSVNLSAPFLLLQHLAPRMAERGWGRVVNIGSCYAFVSRPGRIAYATSKAGLEGITRTAALEFASQGVLVNSVCPGFVETDMTRQNNSPDQIAALCERIPIGRLATPAEITALVVFLASDRNTYITGQSIVIDGGFLAQ